MAKVKLNPMFEELHGKLGDIVFRESYGQTVMGRIPDLSGVVPTQAQVEVRERFTQAAIYGRMALADPATAELYKDAADQKGKPVFALLVADFFNTPVVDEVDISEYDGSIGSPIYIRAHDDFSVQLVKVTIFNAAGNSLEDGEAQVDAGSGRWKYTAQTQILPSINLRIVVEVTDRPGNVTQNESQRNVN